MIAPFLRYDKDPYLVVDGDGQLVYVQDAYTVSDQLPARDLVRHGRARRGRSGFGGEDDQLHPQQREDHDRRLRRHDALLRRGSRPSR